MTTLSLSELKRIGQEEDKDIFERQTITSLLYVLQSITSSILVAYIWSQLQIALTWYNLFLWFLYAILQGTCMMGIWVIGHECNHGAPTDYTWLNDSIGFILHSALLVPYFSWQYTHKIHHRFTNHISKGETHVPNLSPPGKLILRIERLLGKDAFTFLNLFLSLIFGWYLYLIINVTGTLGSNVPIYNRSHFNPYSGIFPKELRRKITASLVGISLTLICLLYLFSQTSFLFILYWYILPYTVCNMWLVFYTLMQHKDPNIPHYGDSKFDWLKGALSTVDRDYGIFDWLHFHIGSSHLVHHLFPRVPHYNAVKLTKIFRRKLPLFEARHIKGNPLVAAFKLRRDYTYLENHDDVYRLLSYRE